MIDSATFSEQQPPKWSPQSDRSVTLHDESATTPHRPTREPKPLPSPAANTTPTRTTAASTPPERRSRSGFRNASRDRVRSSDRVSQVLTFAQDTPAQIPSIARTRSRNGVANGLQSSSIAYVYAEEANGDESGLKTTAFSEKKTVSGGSESSVHGFSRRIKSSASLLLAKGGTTLMNAKSDGSDSLGVRSSHGLGAGENHVRMRKVSSSPNMARIGIDAPLSAQELRLTTKMLRLEQELQNIRLQLRQRKDKAESLLLTFLHRGAFVSNSLLGLWMFCTRFLHNLRRSTSLGQIAWSLVVAQRLPDTLIPTHTLLRVLWSAFRGSFPLLVGSGLLLRDDDSQRNAGFLISAAYSVALGLHYQYLPWCNYFNVFFLLLSMAAYNYSQFPTFQDLPML